MARKKEIKSIKNVYMLTEKVHRQYRIFKEEFEKKINLLLHIPYKSKDEFVKALESVSEKPIHDLIKAEVSKTNKISNLLTHYCIEEIRGEKHIIDRLGDAEGIEVISTENGYFARRIIQDIDHEKAFKFELIKELVEKLYLEIRSLEMKNGRLATLDGLLGDGDYSNCDESSYRRGIHDTLSFIQNLEYSNELLEIIEFGKKKMTQTTFETNKDFASIITSFYNITGSISKACRFVADHFLPKNGIPLNPKSLEVEYNLVVNKDYCNEIQTLIDAKLSEDQAIRQISKKTGVKVNELRSAYTKNSL